MSSDSSKRPLASPWLVAFNDPVANFKCFSPCVRLCDVNSDGEYRLLVADADKKLKVYKGTALASEHALLDNPSALAVFYSDLSKPQTPSVAVAAGSFIFIYRNLRPYYKFTLPPVDLDNSELEVWNSIRNGKYESADIIRQLKELRDSNGVELSSRSLTLLSFTESREQNSYLESQKHLPLIQLTVATCMETLYKNIVNERSVSSLVIGTESKQILILDPSGTNVIKKFALPAVPVFLSVIGTLDVEYRLIIACRNGKIYSIKKGKLMGSVIELESQPCGLAVIDKQILVACLDNNLHSFHFKGKKNYTIPLPDTITNLEVLQLKRMKNTSALLVGLGNGEVRCYNNKYLVSQFQLNDSIAAMRFGPYGREESSLCIVTQSGSLFIRMLQRSATLEGGSATPGPPPEQEIPLNIPKKTKLYVEQTQRERDQAAEMHRLFQRDLCKLRLNTARAYVKILSEGAGPISSVGGISMRLDAKVQGLGPNFALKLGLKNTGTKPVYDLTIAIHFNHAIYRIPTGCGCIVVPTVIPGVESQFAIQIRSIDSGGAADAIRVFVSQAKSSIPIISAIVNMPVSEPDE